jgi:hypothetical protein
LTASVCLAGLPRDSSLTASFTGLTSSTLTSRLYPCHSLVMRYSKIPQCVLARTRVAYYMVHRLFYMVAPALVFLFFINVVTASISCWALFCGDDLLLTASVFCWTL